MTDWQDAPYWRAIIDGNATKRHVEKAVTSIGPWVNPPLTSLANTPQQKAAAYLAAYKVGWFYKAGRKISTDIASLDWSLSDGDAEEGEEETVLPRPELSIPFESLSPIDQFQRLMEFPNPGQTGRQLMAKTEIRLDFAGAAAWYLEGGESGLPSAIYGISPARMWPSYSKSGQLIGWIMDYDKPSGGTPFDVNEILWFTTGNAADDDIWGVGAVEAVFAQVPLTGQMARHTSNVLSSGGRLAGMMWPKERSLSEDEFDDAQRAYRNVASDPDSAKRLLIFPEPMEYAVGASTPAEIGIPELAVLNRDEILTAFPISPYMLGVPTPGGLNSGEVRREDRRDYWEGTIHPRADLLEEAIQVGLLARYEQVMGQTFDYEITEPNLDDAATLTGKADAFKDLVSIGLDPAESLKAVGLNHIKFLGLPALIDPVQQQAMQEEALQAQADAPPPPPAKAHKTHVEEQRDAVLDPAVDKAKAILSAFFEAQAERVIERIRSMPIAKSVRRDAAKTNPWWDSTEDVLLTDAMHTIYLQVGRGGLQTVADTLDRTIGNRMVKNVLADLLTYGGERVKDINARTMQALSIQLAEGTRRGYSIAQLVDGVAAEGFSGVRGVTLDNGTPAFGELRAETIARTESMLSYNRATVTSYGEFGITTLLAYDGDQDDECAERDGQEFSIDEALDIEDHPNGTLAWSPVVDKSVHEVSLIERVLDTIKSMATPTPVYITMPSINPPDITVNTPDVRFTAPDVMVESPVHVDVHVPEAAPPVVNVAAADVQVTLPQAEAPIIKVSVPKAEPPIVNVAPAEVAVTVNVPEVKPVRRKVERDKDGHITGLVDS